MTIHRGSGKRGEGEGTNDKIPKWLFLTYGTYCWLSLNLETGICIKAMTHETYGLFAHCCFLLFSFFPFSEKERGLLLLLSMARDLEIGLEREMFATTTDGVCLSLLSCLFGSVHPAPTTGEPGKK